MEAEIRAVLGKYGYQAVREFLDNEMLQTYQYLNSYFSTDSKKEKPVRNVVVNPVTSVAPVAPVQEIPLKPESMALSPGEKTVSLAATQATPAKQRKNTQMALTKVAEPTPEPAPAPEEKPKKKYYYKKKA